jgi:hypothetical protein
VFKEVAERSHVCEPVNANGPVTSGLHPLLAKA